MGCIKTLVELLSLERLRAKVSRKDSEGIAVSVDRKDADGICPVVALVSSKIKAFVTKIADALKVSVSKRGEELTVMCSLVCAVAEKSYIILSEAEIQLDETGTPMSVSVESNTKWTIE